MARHAVKPSTQPNNHIPQRAVIQVDDAPPSDIMNIDIALIAMIDMRVQHRRDQIMRRANRMNVPGQMQIKMLHRHNLAVTAAGRAALDAKGRPLRRLPNGNHRPFADMLHRLPNADRRSRFALAQRRRRNRRDIDILGIRPTLQFVQRLKVDLGDVLAIMFQIGFRIQSHLLGDLIDRNQFRILRDCQIRRHDHELPSFIFSLMIVPDRAQTQASLTAAIS